jgi:hypothetical protein
MISNAFEIVRDPEPVGHALHDARVLLQCWDRMDVSQHRHQIMADQMLAHIDYVVLLPDEARCMRIALFNSTHRS